MDEAKTQNSRDLQDALNTLTAEKSALKEQLDRLTAAEEVWEQELRALSLVREELNDGLSFRVFEQHCLFGRTAEEVATALNTSVNNVHQVKSRITRRLRKTVKRLHDLEDE